MKNQDKVKVQRDGPTKPLNQELREITISSTDQSKKFQRMYNLT